MEPEVFVDVVRSALTLVAILVCASIIPSLVVGLIVSIFQAATSINEQTLSFLPRLIVTVLALILGAHWGLEKMMSFFKEMIHLIPQVIG
ncbi:Flagellar biosynthetic protein FliQ [Anaerobiospirillum thomasii]|uniref:Flagellar biosynthetic protein FliQ n=1 Tax=Anaerobiospirillum thomasii TaxID=179995 RepID=A0A2X0V657_9GAMM|nr:flagellar biosynthesis protein FliQ [Anaerobiospirillum thomasii]SPT69934.1 Flagellar biosynthetic protein FliQ [Anaerobiospirillum thomasii]SPT71418.1 Flagellar biosynthetic protein FliQ [Anaerobiospirillum thomasii]